MSNLQESTPKPQKLNLRDYIAQREQKSGLPRMLFSARHPLLSIASRVAGNEYKEAIASAEKSNEMCRMMSVVSHDFECIVDLKGETTYASAACEKITGYSPQEFIDDPKLLEKITHPEDKNLMHSHLAHMDREGKPESIDFRIIAKDAKERWLNHVCAPVHDKNGAVIGRFSSNRDITDRKKVEQILTESKKKFKAITLNAKDAILLLDGRNRVLFWNPAAEKMFGYSRKDALGMNLFALLTKEECMPIYQRTLEELKVSAEQRIIEGKTLETCALRRDGDEFPVELSISRFRTGEKEYVAAIIRDVGERKQLEAQVRQAQKLESIGFLAAGIAHDFNNLLAAIMGHEELLRLKVAGMSEASQKELIQVVLEHLSPIESSASRGRELASQMMGFARKGKYAPKKLDPNALVRDAANILSKGFSGPAQYDIIVDARSRHLIFADESQVYQVVQNLANNAKDAMPQGGRITISTQDISTAGFHSLFREVPAGAYTKLSVSDNGTGIRGDVFKNMFDPFYTTKEAGKGTGLGLSVVHGIVTNHKGYLNVLTEIGKGTTFEMYFPALEEMAVQRTAKAAVASGPIHGSVLYVDDDPVLRVMANDMLVSMGLQAETASGIAEALRKCGESKFDLVITDLIMKNGERGDALFRMLKANDPEMPIAITSGYSDESSVQKLLEMGAEDFLPKPFNMKNLRDAIASIIPQPDKAEKGDAGSGQKEPPK